MEISILQSTIPKCIIPRNNFTKSPHFHTQFPFLFNSKRYPLARKLQFPHINDQKLSYGATRASSSSVGETSANIDSKDEDLVFVAGATGKVGSRTVRELLKLGFRVRAGVRSAQRAESLVESVKQMKFDSEASSAAQPIEKLEVVECDLEINDRIVPALGRASVVICCIGASEKEIFDVTGPYRIDYQATENLIEAASYAKAHHFILLTSLGTNKVGFPAAILNLFWGVLIWKRKAEEALIASGLPYTIVRPGGMERPTDSFKETHNLTLSEEDTLFGGQVSNLQVAELIAFMAQNRDLSFCKVVEVVAETTAPLTPMKDLLVKIPSKREDMNKAKTQEPAISVESQPSDSKSSVPLAEVPSQVKEKEKDVAADKPDADSSTCSEVEVTTAVTGNEAATSKSVLPRPSSPYTAYEDLKPPSSPCPSVPGSQKNKMEVTDAVADILNTPPADSETNNGSPITMTKSPKVRPLSPYAVYEDLRPPSSPSPSPPSIFKKESLETSQKVDGVVAAVNGPLLETIQQIPEFCHSPYPAYEDLKPPTSPTPSVPKSNATSTTSSSAESKTNPTSSIDLQMPTIEEKAESEQKPAEPKPRPLSPYTMYDDMKPPSSPMPSPRNL